MSKCCVCRHLATLLGFVCTPALLFRPLARGLRARPCPSVGSAQTRATQGGVRDKDRCSHRTVTVAVPLKGF